MNGFAFALCMIVVFIGALIAGVWVLVCREDDDQDRDYDLDADTL